MALYIGTNTASLSAQRSLISSQSNLQTSFERLSSGTRINSAADDAAGMAIASRLTAQASGLQVAQRNAANGISLVETADAAMGTMVDLLTRARDLTLQYSDGTLSATDKTAILAEVDDINGELQRVLENSEFAGVGLFTSGTGNLGIAGGNGGADIAIDASGTTISVNIAVAAGNDITGAFNFLDLNFQDSSNGNDAAFSIVPDGTGGTDVNSVDEIDDIIAVVNGVRADFGAKANTFQSAIENLAAMEQGITAAAGRILDTDFARESAELAKNQILQQAGTSILAQANQSTQSVLSLLQ